MLAVVSHNRVIRMQLTREMLPSRFYLIVSLFVLTAAEVDEKCFNLCRQFVRHVMKIKKPASGSSLALAGGITSKASEFCSGQLNNKETCDKLVKNTWNVLIAIEIGSKPDTICRLLETCQRNKTKVIVKQDTAETFRKFLPNCGTIFDDPARFTAICLKLPTVTQQMVDLFSRVLKGGDFAAEAQKCSKSGKEIGCQLKHASLQNKVALTLTYTMLPSYSELKARVKDRFLEPGRMCQVGRSTIGRENEVIEERLVSLKAECQSTCRFATLNFFSSFSSENRNITEAVSNFQVACTFVKVTQPGKCEKLYKFANDYKDEFSTTMAGQFCSSKDVCQVPSQNELEMHMKKYCNGTLAKDHNSFHGVRFSARGGSRSLTASIWHTGIIIIIAPVISCWSGF